MEFKKSIKKGICKVTRCSKRVEKDCICPKHRKRLLKEKDLAAYTFYALRSNAKRRGKEFELTLAQFRLFCCGSGYLEAKGKDANSASIDRINPNLGYTLANIRVITLSLNAKKGSEEDYPF